jgi:hypothetical protein
MTHSSSAKLGSNSLIRLSPSPAPVFWKFLGTGIPPHPRYDLILEIHPLLPVPITPNLKYTKSIPMSHPNPTQQAAPREAHDDIILKFRTITSMLQVLQQLPSEEKKPMELRTRDERQELRVLGAMATLLVQRFQVTAVGTGGSASEVALVACAEDNSRSDKPDEEASLTNAFVATANPRRVSAGPRISVIQSLRSFVNTSQPLGPIISNW